MSPSSSRYGRPRSGASWLVPRLAGPLLILGVWEIVARVWLERRFLIAAPTQIVTELWYHWDSYLPHIKVTAAEAALGFLMGNAAGIVLAVAIVQVPVVDKLILRMSVFLSSMPLLLLAPILTLMFFGEAAKIALVVILVFFPTVIATLVGLRSVDGTMRDLVRSMGGGRWFQLWKLRMWAAIPWIVAALRIAAPAAVLGAMLAEFFGADRGLGIAIVSAMSGLDTTRVWTLATLATALAGGTYALLTLLSRVVVRWTPLLSTGKRAADSTRFSGAWSRFSVSIISIAGIALLWEVGLRMLPVNRFFVRGPLEVLRYLVGVGANGPNWKLVFSEVPVTLLDSGVGFVLGTLAAVIIAIAFVQVPVLERTFLPSVIALQSVPLVVYVPLMVIAVGRGFVATASIAALITLFITLVAVSYGLRAVPVEGEDLFRVNDASSWVVMWKLRIPTALPALFASAKIAVIGSVIGATVAEWLATGRGLGRTMVVARFKSDVDLLWAAGVVVTMLSVLGYGLLGLAERRVLARYAPEQVYG
jgi:sulfonate transport system permease protein